VKPTLETVKINDESGENAVTDIRYRINTRLSKVRRGEGRKETHLAAINSDLELLKSLDFNNFVEMQKKIKNVFDNCN
jgi:hypothetical protein